MSKSPSAWSIDMRNKLRTTAPTLSCALGTPERKIIDAAAECLAEVSIDQYIVGSLLDINNKAGLELEQFVGIFGFGRLQGRRATGVVRIELTQVSTQNTDIQLGTAFYTKSGLPGTGAALYFASTQAVTLVAGNYTCDVPVECTLVGTAGNVPPDSVTSLGNVLGSASCTNLAAFTGGVDIETDEELRQRFKDTFLRNIAGTQDFYEGLAFQNKFVSKVAAFGPIRVYETEVAVPSGTVTLPVTADVKYAWPKSAKVFKNLGQDDEVFYREVNDFTFTAGASPQLTRVTSGQMVAGDIVNVEFEYTTRGSRNDPQNGITNKVDIFVNGADPYNVTERTVIPATTLSVTPTDELYTGKFARVGTAGTPSATSRFMRLGSVPVVSFPSTLVVGGVTYTLGTHYHVLRGTTLDRGSPREIAGIEWLASGPSSGVAITVTYAYNRVPEVLNAVMKKAKQITTDVLVHQATYRYLRLYLSIEYDRGFIPSQVNSAIQDRLKQYFAGLPFGSWIEFSDLSLAVHQVLGVDNVNITTSMENPTDYGVKTYGADTDTSPLTVETTDFKMNDDMLPIFLEAVITRKPNR